MWMFSFFFRSRGIKAVLWQIEREERTSACRNHNPPLAPTGTSPLPTRAQVSRRFARYVAKTASRFPNGPARGSGLNSGSCFCDPHISEGKSEVVVSALGLSALGAKSQNNLCKREFWIFSFLQNGHIYKCGSKLQKAEEPVSMRAEMDKTLRCNANQQGVFHCSARRLGGQAPLLAASGLCAKLNKIPINT